MLVQMPLISCVSQPYFADLSNKEIALLVNPYQSYRLFDFKLSIKTNAEGLSAEFAPQQRVTPSVPRCLLAHLLLNQPWQALLQPTHAQAGLRSMSRSPSMPSEIILIERKHTAIKMKGAFLNSTFKEVHRKDPIKSATYLLTGRP